MSDRTRPEDGSLSENDAFAVTLRRLISDSGMSLQDLVRELRRRGTPVTLATLSYWQTGRSRPERAGSLKAVAALEDVFAIERGSLSSLFPERKPRGRSAARVVRPSADEIMPVVKLERMREELGMGYRDGLVRLSVHERLHIGQDRRDMRLTTRQILRAEREGADRLLQVLWVPEGIQAQQMDPKALVNCTMGRILTDPDAELAGVEVLLSRPLRHGESTIIQTEITWVTDEVMGSMHERRFASSCREYVLEVVFDRDDLPSSVGAYRGTGTEDDDEIVGTPLTLRMGLAQLVVLNATVGTAGIKWQWGQTLEEVRGGD